MLAIYGNRERPATHTRYNFVEFVGGMVAMSGGDHGRSKRSMDYGRNAQLTSIQKEFTKYLENGVWFLTIYNDAPMHVDLALGLTLVTEELCPFNCRGHGMCIAGSCKCDPGYGGESCESSKFQTFLDECSSIKICYF